MCFGERERERQTDRDRHTHTHTQRDTGRRTERGRERHSETYSQSACDIADKKLAAVEERLCFSVENDSNPKHKDVLLEHARWFMDEKRVSTSLSVFDRLLVISPVIFVQSFGSILRDCL